MVSIRHGLLTKKHPLVKTAFKVNQYYHTDWMIEDELLLELECLHVDAVYENFMYQVAGGTLQVNKAESL